jgi:hypothetical protein
VVLVVRLPLRAAVASDLINWGVTVPSGAFPAPHLLPMMFFKVERGALKL